MHYNLLTSISLEFCMIVAAAVSFALGMWQDFGPQHDPDEPRVNWVEGVAISKLIFIVIH